VHDRVDLFGRQDVRHQVPALDIAPYELVVRAAADSVQVVEGGAVVELVEDDDLNEK
jgi:hypothetical protein